MSENKQAPRLTESIKEIIFGGEQKPGEQPAPGQGKGPGARSSAEEFEGQQLADRLQSLFSRKEVVSASRLQILGLEKIRERLGEKWEAKRDHVNRIADTVVHKRLTPADIYRRHGDLGFVIIFGDLAKSEADAKSAMIAEEIWQQIFGSEIDSEEVEVQSVTVEVDGQVVVKNVNPIESIVRLVEEAERQQQDQLRSDEPTSGAMEIDSLESLVDNASLPKVKFVYRPIWDLRREAVLTYLCVAADQPEESNDSPGYRAADQEQTCRLLAEVDRLSLVNTVRSVGRLVLQDRRFLVGCRVHYEALAQRRHCMAFAELCRSISESLRPLLIFEVVGMPLGVPQTRLAQILLPFKPFCRAIHCHARLETTDFGIFQDTGIAALGVDIAGNKAGEARVIKSAASFAAKAKLSGFKSFIHGIDSLSLATSIVCAGFDYMSGEVVGSAVHKLEHAYRFDGLDLVRKLAVNR